MRTSPRLSWHLPCIPASALIALVLTSSMSAQSAPTATASTSPGSGAAAPGSEQPIVLNPFEVSTSHDTGYFSPNTLAGTRLNNNIGDLPSSVTVVTKQQLEDTNSLNLNDVFRYESNTEGASTYTPFVTVRGNLSDALGGGGSTSGSFASAGDTGNRVRGLSTVDNQQDNFFSLYRIPFDSYNTQSIEIDRGPNSIVFGTGSPAGIVNDSRTQASPDKQSGEVALQAGSFGTYRESVGLNIPIVPHVLGLYLAQEYTNLGFEQKPSSDITRRQYASFTFVPFKSGKTKLTGSFENYNNYANDPNGITPIDFVTPWLASGRPVYNPLNNVVTYLNTGKTMGPYVAGTTYPDYVAGGATQAVLGTSTSAFFVPSLTYLSAGHNVMFIDQGVVQNFFRGQQTAYSIPGFVPATLTASQALVNEERLTYTTQLPSPAQYASWYTPGVVSKDIYDWSSININSIDHTETSAKTYNLNFQQEILPHLNFDLGWFRQELKQIIDSPLSQANATTMYVDTNEYLPNGQPNVHLGQPFLDVYSSDVYSEPEINNNWRGTLEYELDLRDKVPSWLSWLGHHRFMGVFSQHDDVQTSLRYRPAIDGGDANYLPTTTALNSTSGYSYAASNSAIEQWYYLAGNATNPTGHATEGPGFFSRPTFGGPTSATITTYNYAANAWQNSTVNMDSLLYATGGLSENLQDSKTYFMQNFLFNDRIVTTLGINDDQVKNRQTIFPATNATAVEFPNGYANQSVWYNEGPWNYIGGNTSTIGFVAHPFKNWSYIDGLANEGNIIAQIARTLSFTFNKANNFNPPAAYYTDFFGNPLGKPQGSEKDYGFEIATPDNKLFMRATWFRTTNQNQVYAPTGTGRAQYIDRNEVVNWATAVVEIRNGESPADPNFGNTNVYPLSAAEQSQISQLTGFPYPLGGNVGVNGNFINPTGTENGVAHGTEMELTYTPMPNWTMHVTWGRQLTTVSGIDAQAQAFVNARMPVWLSYKATDLPNVYTLANGGTLYVGNFWQSYGYDGNVTGPSNTNGLGTTVQNYYNNVEASSLTVDEAGNGALAANQREYSWRYVTNYTVDRGSLKGVGFGTGVRYDGRANAGYYGNTSLLNASGQIAVPNLLLPIYTPAKLHLDAWVSYQFKLPWSDGKIKGKVQLNVADLTSNGYLLPVSYNFDGSPAAERIIPPRTYSLQTKFSF